jgi:metal-responsive CopG/Arc/MetJ family transcriptional regulator
MKGAIINLSLPKEFLKKIDREAEREERTRSELMRVAIKSYLEKREAWDKIFDYADRHVKKRGLKPSDVNKAIAEARRAS